MRGSEYQEVYLTFSPRFERIWLESKKRLLDYVAQKPAIFDSEASMLSACTVGRKSTYPPKLSASLLDQLRKVLGLESVKDADGNIIQEAPLADWANLRQRALDIAIREINKKTDLNIAIESLETITSSAGDVVDFRDQDPRSTRTKRLKRAKKYSN